MTSIDALTTLSKEELEAVIRDVENPIEVRRMARKYLNVITNTQPDAQRYQTVLIVPKLAEAASEDE